VEATSRRASTARQITSWLIVAIQALALLALSESAWAIDASSAKLIDQGFKIFTNETFKGNGRTCSTCHLPKGDFTISPADIPALSAHQKKLLFGTNIAPGNAGNGTLENTTMVQTLGLFDINDGVGGTSEEVGSVNTPAGPFRASMTIAGLSFTTSNLLPDFCASDSAPEFIENGMDLVEVVCGTLPADFPANATPIPVTDVFLNDSPPTLGTLTPGVDEGTRNVELGWAGDGAITDPDIFGTTTTKRNQDCQDAVNEANADTLDLTKTLRVFSLTAIKTHLTRSLNRVPGVDFRCPTPEELDAIAAFQEYLGRRFELALVQGVESDADDGSDTLNNFAGGTQTDPSQPVITFNDTTAETGKAIFLNGNAECNLCHFNAGANDATGLVHAPNPNDPSAPFPGRNFTSKQLIDLMRCTDVNGSPTMCMNGSTATAHGLNAMIAPVVFPQDSGDKVANGATALSSTGSDCNNGINSGGNIGCVSGSGLKAGAFNLQPLIEAARKKSFFHNGSFNTLESAVSFYFSPAGDTIKAFTAPRKGQTGVQALATLATTYFSDPTATQDVLNTLGFFLRSLSAVYAIADCERLVGDSVTLIDLNKPTDVQVMLCSGELDDVNRLIAGAQVTVPPNYLAVQAQAEKLKAQLSIAAEHRNRGKLVGIINQLKTMRQSIATISPDLPE
jgi:cytochrome c peroxidase